MTLDPRTAQEEILLDIPRWDFDWQLNYQPTEDIEIKRGDTIRAECSWDRTGRRASTTRCATRCSAPSTGSRRAESASPPGPACCGPTPGATSSAQWSSSSTLGRIRAAYGARLIGFGAGPLVVALATLMPVS